MYASATRPFASLVVLALSVLLSGFHAPAPEAGPAPAKDDLHALQQMFFLKKMKPDVERIGVIWKRGGAGQKAKLEAIRRAVQSIQGQLFVAYVEGENEIGSQFRMLTREHKVNALWVVENDGIVDADAPRQFLISNATRKGIPLLAPSADWVDDGAPMTVEKGADGFRVLVNEPAAAAASINVQGAGDGFEVVLASN